MQVDVVLSHSIVNFSPLFTEIADTYFENGMFAEARPIYEMLGADAAVNNVPTFTDSVTYFSPISLDEQHPHPDAGSLLSAQPRRCARRCRSI